MGCSTLVTITNPGTWIDLSGSTFTMGVSLPTCIKAQAAHRSGNIHLDGRGAIFVQTAINQIPVIFNGGQDSGSQNLSVDARMGVTPPHVTTVAAVSGLAANDTAKLADTNTDAHVQSVRILAVGTCSTTCDYILDTPLYDDFFVLAGGKLTRWLWNSGNELKNLTVDCAAFAGGIGVEWFSQVEGSVENVITKNCPKGALYAQEGIANNYNNLRFVQANGNASSFSQWESQTEGNISNVQSEGKGVGGFDFNFKQVHGMNISNVVVSNGYGNGRTFKYYRSTFNNASGIVLNNCGAAVGAITGIAINAAGSGYTVNDILTVVQGGASGGTVKVTTVSGGAITGLIINTPGSGYTVATGLSLTGGTGTGATLNTTTVGGVQICVKLERSSFNNTFHGLSAVSGYGVTWASSSGSSNNECYGCFLGYGQQGIIDGVEDFSTQPNPTGLTVTATKTGAGPTNCTATFVRTVGSWAGDTNSHGDNRSLVAYFVGFTNAANNYPANSFLVTSTSTTTNPGDTLNTLDPRCVVVNETSTAAAVSAAYAYPNHANKFFGGTIGYMRGTAGIMINIDGLGWVFDGVTIADDNGIATAGLGWRGQGTNGPGGAFTSTPQLNMNPSDGYFGQKTKVINDTFSGFPTNFDVEFGQTGSNPTNEYLAGNTFADGVRRVNQGTGNMFVGNTGDLPPLSQSLIADSSGITTTTAATAVTQFSFSIPRNAVVSFSCTGSYIQATGNAAVGMAIQGGTNAPTNLSARGRLDLSATTYSSADSGNITSTTYTSVLAPTSTNFGTVFPWALSGTIETGSSKSILNIGFYTGNGADAVTIKRGSKCVLDPLS
jgi:hypothetical protein